MTSNESTTEPATDRPVLRVVSGDATPEEIAAIVAVLTAASADGHGDEPPSQRSLWTDSARVPGSRITPGPGAWRASALPR